MTEVYDQLLKLKSKGECGVLITVVDKEGHGPAVLGAKMLVRRSGEKKGTVGGGALEFAALKHASKIIELQKSELKKYLLNPDDEIIEGEKTGMLCGGTISLFFEYIGPSVRLYIFGAGHIGKALSYHLKNLDYYITLVDNRQGMPETVENIQHRITVDYETALKDEPVPSNAFFIIASHSHKLDYIILKRIYQAQWNPAYIGMVASKRKAPHMIRQLKEELGDNLNFDILYAPVGLDTGGPSPDEIAISIIAEIQAIRYNKKGHRHMKL